MSQNVTFDLADTKVPAGTLKMQVTVDLTNFSLCTGTVHLLAGTLTGTGTLFLSELKVGCLVMKATGGNQYVIVTGITNNLLATVDNVTYTWDAGATFKALVFPTENLIFNMDEHVEKVDVKIGIYEYDDFTMEFADDYSWYNAGFWYNLFRIIAGSPVKLFIRMEELQGGTPTDSFVTYGEVNQTTVEFSELAIENITSPASGVKIRTVRMSIVSGLNLLKNITIAQLVEETKLYIKVSHLLYSGGSPHTHQITSGQYDWIKLIDVINSIMVLGYGQSYDTNLCIPPANEDLLSYIHQDTTGGYWYGAIFTNTVTSVDFNLLFNQIYIYGWQGTGDGYFESGSTLYFGNTFPSAFELLQSICFQFGFIPRYFYGKADGTYDNATPANNMHRVELLCRGNNANTIIPQGEVIDSSTNLYSPYIVNNVRGTFQQNSNESNYFFNSSLIPKSTLIAEVYGSAPPYLKFDVDLQNLFASRKTVIDGTLAINSTYIATSMYLNDDTLPLDGGGTVDIMWCCNGARFYDYVNGAYSTPDYTGSSISFPTYDIFCRSLARYYYYKFKGQATFARKYSDVRSTDLSAVTSQKNTQCLRRIEITDEFSTRNFYIIEVRKSYTKNTAQITMFEE